MMKHFTMAALTLGALAVGGCSIEAGSDVRQTEARATLSCEDHDGINPMMAALAVAMGREMGEIDALKYLEVSNGTTRISQAGKDACVANNATGCPNVSSILLLQDSSINGSGKLDQNDFNATTFREELRSRFDRQANHEKNLSMNAKDRVPGKHQLSPVGVTDNGACGPHVDFAANGDQNNLVERLVFFGGENNPYLAYMKSDGIVSIDPTGTMTGDTSTSDNMCFSTCFAYGWSYYGKCCSCNGKQGSFGWLSGSTMYCSY